jgi:hypothetical protein
MRQAPNAGVGRVKGGIMIKHAGYWAECFEDYRVSLPWHGSGSKPFRQVYFKEIAEMCHCNTATVSSWLHGRRTPAFVRLFRLWAYLTAIGYQVRDIERLSAASGMKELVLLLGYDVISIDQAVAVTGLSRDALSRQLKANKFSNVDEHKLLDFVQNYRAELRDVQDLARQKYTPVKPFVPLTAQRLQKPKPRHRKKSFRKTPDKYGTALTLMAKQLVQFSVYVRGIRTENTDFTEVAAASVRLTGLLTTRAAKKSAMADTTLKSSQKGRIAQHVKNATTD